MGARTGRRELWRGVWLLVVPALAVVWLCAALESDDTVVAAVPALAEVPMLRAPFVDSIAAAVVVADSGGVDRATARAVAERSMSDPALLAALADPVAAAHVAWRAGAVPVVVLEPEGVARPVVARARDVDAELGRRLDAGPAVTPAPVTVTATPIDSVRRLRSGAGLVAVLAVTVGLVGILRSRSRALAVATAGRRVVLSAAVVGAAGLLLAVPALRTLDWPGAVPGALVAAAGSSWWMAVVAVVAVGAVVVALGGRVAGWADQGGLLGVIGFRRWAANRAVSRADAEALRLIAQEAFFAEGGDDEVAARAPDGPEDEEGAPGPGPAAPVGSPSSDRSGSADADDERAAALAADRRAALERIDGTSSSRLRTFRPR